MRNMIFDISIYVVLCSLPVSILAKYLEQKTYGSTWKKIVRLIKYGSTLLYEGGGLALLIVLATYQLDRLEYIFGDAVRDIFVSEGFRPFLLIIPIVLAIHIIIFYIRQKLLLATVLMVIYCTIMVHLWIPARWDLVTVFGILSLLYLVRLIIKNN